MVFVPQRVSDPVSISLALLQTDDFPTVTRPLDRMHETGTAALGPLDTFLCIVRRFPPTIGSEDTL